MKINSIQSKFLIVVISAMLTIAVLAGGISLFEIDSFVDESTWEHVSATCEKEAALINDIFGDMEKSVNIMESYVLSLVSDLTDIKDRNMQNEILNKSEIMFTDVADNTPGAIAYYMRFAPEISDNLTGFFYSKPSMNEDFVSLVPTDLYAYSKSDTERVGWFWEPYYAGEPIWMMPYYNQNTDIFMISYVIPLYYEHQFIGIVGMDFDYTILTDKIDEIKIYDNGFAHLEVNDAIAYHKDIKPGGAIPYIADDYMQVSQKLGNGMILVLSAGYDDIREIRYDIAFKILITVAVLCVIFSLIMIVAVKKLVKPLKKLTKAAEQLSDGSYDVEIDHSNTDEIELLSNAFKKMTHQLQEHDKIQHMLANRDSLTGLRNTTSYKAWVDEFNENIQNYKNEFGLIVMDINNLKETNDKYGHDIGNKLIVTVAQTLSGIFKRSPVFRIGGDEFLVILQDRDLSDYDKLINTFDEICSSESITASGEIIPVSVAKGVGFFDEKKDSSFIDVFNRADDMMYENKRGIKKLPKIR